MTRSASPFRPLAALMAVVLLALAAGPAAAAVAEAGRHACCSDACPPPSPADALTCCAQSPAVAGEAASVPAPPGVRVLVAAMWAPLIPRPAERPAVAPADTGPPPARRHLTLSVFLV